MATEVEYALMAGRVYQSTGATINWLPDLQSLGWTEFFLQQQPSGFEAVSFQKGNEIVISFAGTGSNVDWWANAGGFFGVTTEQLRQAADYYLQVKAANSGATISLTGHSLGGGLASLMAVFFGENAVTFDQAPFKNSASVSVATTLKEYLLNERGYSEVTLQGLTNFISAAASGGIPNNNNVIDFSVQGEILSAASGLRIGTPTSWTHGAPDLTLAIDLHSHALLTAFLQSDRTAPAQQSLSDVTFKLPDVVRMIFDNNLYKFSTALNSNQENFIERLVRHENGIMGDPTKNELPIRADAMLTRFTSDLWKLAQDGGLTMADDSFASVKLVSQTLIAFAMQKYYTETQASAGYNQKLFNDLDAGSSGGIRFDRADVGANLAATKGYDLYFQTYLANFFSPSDRDRIIDLLPGLRDWYVQAGQSGMNATDTQNRGAFMLGGNGADDLTGGSQIDLLVGNVGGDKLTGGGGDDTLLGGTGLDTYYYNTGDGHDRIEDADARGRIVVNEQMLMGGVKKADHTYWESADGTIKYEMSGTDLVVKLNNVVIMTVNENFQSGQFGIRLLDTSALPNGTPPTINYDNGYTTDVISLPPGPVEFNGSDQFITQEGPINSIVQGNYGPDLIWADGILTTFKAQNQVVSGGDGSDALIGDFNDRLYGEGGDDLIRANWGADVVYGGAGHDLVFADLNYFGQVQAGTYDDYLDGGDDADSLNGMAGNDVLLGGTGDDELFGDDYPVYTQRPAGNDYLNGGDGNDRLYAGLGDDALYGGAGDDRLFGDNRPAGEDYYVWTERPWINGEWFQGYDFGVVVGAGVPIFSVEGGRDYLEGGVGDDYLQGDGGDDVLLGGDDNDQLWGDDQQIAMVQEGADWLDGGAGIDQLVGGGGADTLSGGADDDVLYGDYLGNATLGLNDILDGGAGLDVLYGGGGADLLDGGTEADVLWGEAGDDDLYGGAGDDRLHGGEGHDSLVGEAGVDLFFGEAGDDTLFGGEENDQLSGGEGMDVLTGGAGQDLLFGDAGHDTLWGDEGHDQLQGGIGNDGLLGGAGDDLLFGEAGDDTLWGDDGADQLTGGTDNDVHDGGAGSDLYVFNLGDRQDHIFEADVFGEVNTIMFGAGITSQMLTYTQNVAQETLLIQVGAGGDSILIHGFRNTGVNGTGGMQQIAVGGFSYALADLLGLPSGEIVGTYGHDLITTGNGADMIYAGDGNDTITANGGNDILIGGAGSDTYVLNYGDGLDTIYDTATSTEGNRILFGAGIAAANLVYTQGVNSLTIAYNGAADAVQLVGFNQNMALGSLVASTLQFADGSLLNLADRYPTFTNYAPTVVNAIADRIVPEDAPFTIVVPATTFADQDIGDVLTYSAGLADGTALPAWLSFNPLTRTFSGTPDDAQVGTLALRVTATDSRNANVSDLFNLTVSNVNEAPTLATALADQSMTKDTLFNFVVPGNTFADVDPGDTLIYRATLADNSALPLWLTFDPSTRTFSGTPQMVNVGTLNVKVTATDTGSLTVSDIFALTVSHGLNEVTGTAGNDTLTGTIGNDLIQGLGGNDILDGMDGNDTIEGGEGNDQLVGRAGNDLLDGGAGDDTLHGLEGDNTLIGGLGADELNGYTGYDTFIGGLGNDIIRDPMATGSSLTIFNRGDGQDALYMNRGTLRFGVGILPSDVTLQVAIDNSLLLRINGTTDKITLSDWANPFDTTRLNRVEFADGTVWDNVTLQAMISTGTAGNDYLVGTNGNDVLMGLGGNDKIVGYNGDDVFDGGPGNDTLQGIFGGNDTYIFGRGYGFDLVQEEQSGTADTIQLTAGILTVDVTLLQNGAQVLLSLDQSATQIAFTGNEIEQIRFNDGTTWNAAAMASRTLVGAVNAMVGTSANNTFVVDNTLDTVTESANQGTDTIQSLVSYTLPDHVENLTLTGYFGVAGAGNLLNNVIIGNSGSNALVGSVNDYAGGGSDTLQGGAGDDIYTVVGNNDVVIEALNEGIDSITFIGDANRGWSYTLPDNVENMTATSASFVFAGSYRNFTGNALNNMIQGDSDWFNYIDGGLGADTMIGGTTSFPDTYVVDSAGDLIVETGFSQSDLVLSSISYTLGLNLENLTLTGTSAINGTGNELSNVLTGNSAANVLTGGAGNDTYVIGAGDTIVELAGQGTDTVSSDQSYTLSADLENVTLTGTAAINATGNALDNVLTGNSAANVLDGGAGADQLIGGGGDDIYLVGAGDTIVEQPFSGIDTVFADQTFTLSSDVENLTLTGTAAINGTGNASDNILTGNSAANVLTGGTGDDIYVVDGEDTIVENPGEGTDTVQASGSWVLANDVENLTLTGSNAIDGTGNAADNVLIGNSGANVLTGGVGNDTYVVDGGDTIVEVANEGTDTVMSSMTFVLAPDLENLTLTGAAAINGTGNAQNNILNGNTGANVLDGGAGADTMFGDAGDDTYVVDNVGDSVTENAASGIDTVQSSLTYTLGANVENVTLLGNAAINGTGNTLNNILTGNSAANALAGGLGNDTYIVDVGDTVTEAASAGTDTVHSAVTFTLGTNIENLTLTGIAAINGTGNTLNNILVGNSGANVLSGGTGADTMSGGAGDDTYVVDVAGDVVTELANEGTDTVQSAITYTLGNNVENLTLTGTGAINGTGNALDNMLTGNSGTNVLTGGGGNDTYVVGTGDTVTEAASAGTDTVQSSVTWTLAANIENLTLTGTTAINGTGNTSNNVITGNSGANVLNGGTGTDTMAGGAGNDTYVVDNVGDVVTEAAGAGTDTVQSAVTYTLGGDIENLTLTGSSAINGTGNSLNNTIAGNTGNNTLDGGAGVDAMSGGAGNDMYVVDNISDTVTESTSAGTDTVLSAVTFTLGANIENLTLTGTGAINGTGNTLNNTLVGNSGANILSGGTGTDSMSGGAGDDTYVVDVAGDVVTELANEGTDTVQSAITYTLGSNVENLTLTGATAINGTGNTLDNVLTGNGAANVLTGGVGNDTYVVGAVDTIVENAGAGTDTVQSSITWTLGANLENLTLTGTAAINGTGNTLNNVLTGNSGTNVLTGGAGNDTYVVGTGDSVVESAGAGTDTVQSSITWTLGAELENLMLIGTAAINGTGTASNNTLAGNSGNNVLTGLGGNDIYQYSRGGGQDTVVDNSGASDTMQFGVTINPLDLVISRQANDLRLTIHGSTDQVTIQNWYSGATNQAETIQAGNGQTLLSTQVDQLIQAMAGFTQQTGLTWEQAIDQQPQQVQTVLAASWQ